MQVQECHAQHRPKRSFTASDGSKAYILPYKAWGLAICRSPDD